VDPEVTAVQVDKESKGDEISLLDIASFVLRQRRVLLAATFVGALIALVSALRMPLEYTATSSFLPHGGDAGGISGVIGVAQQFGLSVPRSSGGAERSSEFYRDLLQSREILDKMIEQDVEMATDGGLTNVDVAEYFGIEGKTAAEQMALTRRHLIGSVISVTIARVTRVITMGIRTDDPEFSAAIANRLLDLITEFDVGTRQSQASAERRFAQERLGQLQEEIMIAEDSLKAFLVDNRQFLNSPQLTFEHDHLQRQVSMRQELVTAMAQAYEQARVDEVRNLPIITVIDQPEPPALPDGRGRRRKVLLGLILGAVAGLCLAFVREFGERARTEESRDYREFRGTLRDVQADLFGIRRSHKPEPSPVDLDS
jgi:uncharacterized protein involved in exopolysaccharide biosynthesis